MQPDIYKKDDFDFFSTVHSLWRDMDSLGHINHTSYLTYMETVRMNYRNHLAIEENRRDSQIGYILASLKIDYISQVRHPAKFEIGERICRVGTSSFDTITAAFCEHGPIPVAQAQFTLVTYSYANGKKLAVPEAIKAACRPF